MKYLYSLFLIVIAFQLHAQSNFKPGYIVTLKGDTTKGFIDLRQWNENPRDITFKVTEQLASSQYTPDNIKAFGIDKVDHYQSYIGPVTTGAVALADLSIGIDSSFVTSNIFLKILTGGNNLTLYTYRDRLKTRYFIAEKNLIAVELKRYVYLDNNQTDKIREYNFYIQQLLSMVRRFQPDDKQLSEKILGATYQVSQLNDIVFRLNGEINSYAAKISTRKNHRFFIGASANLAKAGFFGEYGFGHADNIFSVGTTAWSFAPAITGGVDFFSKNASKLIFRAEAGFLINKINAKYSNSYLDGVREVGREENLTFNQMMVSINPQFIYNIYNKEKFQFYVAGGLQLNFSSFSNQHFYGTNYFNGTLVGSADKPLLYRKITTTLTAKTGIVLSNGFDIYLGYSPPSMITQYPNQAIDLSFYRIGVNYFLGKKNK